MQFRLTYQEISDLIARKAGRNLPVMYGGPHTVRIAYEVNMFVKTASVGIDLTVDGIDPDGNITLSYNGGMGIDFMIRQAINMAKNQPGGEQRKVICLTASLWVVFSTISSCEISVSTRSSPLSILFRRTFKGYSLWYFSWWRMVKAR